MKIFTYLVTMAALSILLGVLTDVGTGGGLVLDAFGFTNITNPDFDNSPINSDATGIAFIFGIVAAGSIIVGLLTGSVAESFVMGALCSALIVFIRDFIVIYQYFEGSWVFYVLAAVFVPMTIGYVVALVEWWRGSD